MLLQEVVKDGVYVFNQETLRIAVPCREDILNEVFLRHRGAVSYSVSKTRPSRNLELFVKRKKSQDIWQCRRTPVIWKE